MFHPKGEQANKTANNGADQAVPAMLPGILQVATHTKNSADTGKSRVAVE